MVRLHSPQVPKKKTSAKKKKSKYSLATVIFVLFVTVFALLIGFILFQKQQVSIDLTRILASEWNSYKKDKSNFNGGLAMQILSPKDDYFISTGMGNINNTYHFRIASVSKTFTAASIMLLHQKGLLNIDDRITDNIPGMKIPYVPDNENYNLPYKKDISIRMLLMHRAGIFDLSNNAVPSNSFSYDKPYVNQNYIAYIEKSDPNHQFTFDELLGVNASNQLSFFKPGSAYHYSDTGYSLLGKIIERVSQKSYADFVKEELLVPNGLNNTSVVYKGSDQTIPDPYVKGYVWAGGEIADVTKSNLSPHVAEGSIITTPKDLANWAKRLFAGQAGLTKETVKMMMSGESKGDGTKNQYGLGISYFVGKGYGHSGAHEGYLTDMIYNPETNVVYVSFTNIWNCQTCGKSLDSIISELKAMDNSSKKVLQKLGY